MTNLDQARAQARELLRKPVGHALRWRERRGAPFRHELAVCAIFREEALFLNEWIAFHAGVGVTHFYLYNNFSTDNFREVLSPWIARGMVTLKDWDVPVGQLGAYRHCIARARGDCRWLAFIDIDEFLFSPQTIDIRAVLGEYQDLPGIAVWQVFFGSGGHVKRPAMPVVEAYRKRAPLTRTTVKTIANPRLIYTIGIHVSKYWIGEGRDTARRRVQPGLEPVLDRLRINHYWSRSIEDLETKIARNDASTAAGRDRALHLDLEKTLNAETDESIVAVARAIATARAVGGPSYDP